MHNAAIDLIIQVKNAYLSGKESINMPYSRFREELAKKLVSLGYLKSSKVSGGEIVKRLDVVLAYNETTPVLTDVQIFSKPGRRYYVSYTKLKPVLGGLGVSLVSTSKGIMTNNEARKLKVGGELLFSIW